MINYDKSELLKHFDSVIIKIQEIISKDEEDLVLKCIDLTRKKVETV